MTREPGPWIRPAALLLSFALVGACALRSSDDPLARRLDAAEASLATGELDAARAAFESIWRERPGDARALRGLVGSALEARDGDAALVWLDRLAEADPANERSRASARCRALELAAETLLREGASESARIRGVAASLAGHDCPSGIRPGVRARLHLAIAREARREGRDEAALAGYRAALTAEPGFVEPIVGLAALLLERGDRTAAISVLGDGLRVHPDDRRLIEMMVEALTGPPPPAP